MLEKYTLDISWIPKHKLLSGRERDLTEEVTEMALKALRLKP